MTGQTPEEFRERGFLVLGSRLDMLYTAIRERDWDAVEFQFDRVRSQASKLSGTRARPYDPPADPPAAEAESDAGDHIDATDLIRDALSTVLGPTPGHRPAGTVSNPPTIKRNRPIEAPETALSWDKKTTLYRYRGQFVIFAETRQQAAQRVENSAIYFDAAALEPEPTDDER
jgi:hypothetical protein